MADPFGFLSGSGNGVLGGLTPEALLAYAQRQGLGQGGNQPINATDIVLNADTLGLGQPSNLGNNPALAADAGAAFAGPRQIPQSAPQSQAAPIQSGGGGNFLGSGPAGTGNPLAAGLLGALNAGSLPGAIGNLFGGLMTGQRQDITGATYQRQKAIYNAVLPQVGPDQAAALAVNPQVQQIIQSGKFEAQKLNQPIKLGPMDMLVTPKGDLIRAASDTGLWSDDAIHDTAQQYRAGDTSSLNYIGRGAQGPINLQRLREEISRQNRAAGISGTEQAAKNAEFFGVKSAQRAIGTRTAGVELAATEFKQLLPVLTAAVTSVKSTDYPQINKIIQAWQENTGDPNVVKLGGALNTAVNIYARAINPGGQPTVSDKDHARDILQRYWASGQIKAAFDLMTQEIDAALSAPGKVQQQMRERFIGNQGPVGGTPAAPANAPAAPDISGWH